MAIKIALAGNPNCGKTTLFNALTGSNQFVGNWPGVTVEKKEGRLKKGFAPDSREEVILIDLPGIYSLSPYSPEEVVARNYLIKDRPDVIINIVDGTNIERNLYLSTQILELGIPVVLAVNMMDAVERAGDKIHSERLAEKLGCDVAEISALKGTGLEEAAARAVALAKGEATAALAHRFAGDVEEAIQSAEEKLGDAVAKRQRRFFAVKLLERDDKIRAMLAHCPDVSAEIRRLEDAFDDDTESIIANQRYEYISSVMNECYTRKRKEKMSASDRIDRIVTNRWAALPLFAAVMFMVYYISVATVGSFVTDWANDGVFGEGWQLLGIQVPGIPVLAQRGLEAAGCSPWLTSLILDGIIGGVGAVLGFVPQMFVLFAFLAFLEACGYMARVAFIMDRIFRRFGLSGKSFIPMLIGSGCGVPGIMASRTIESDRDRRMTVMTTTFIPCGAKLPIIALISTALFGGSGLVAVSAYFLGIAAVVISGILLKKTKMFAGDPAPFVMELPAYHWPTAGNVLRSVWERGWSFVKKAGTIILLSSIVIWAGSCLGTVDGRFGFGTELELEDSVLGAVGNGIKWIFRPLGFDNATAAIATIMGLVAKEEVVGVFGVLDFAGMTKAAAYSFLAFNLLCAPCFAAIGAIRREMNSAKWTWFAIGYQCGFAYGVSLIIYQLGSLLGGSGNLPGAAAAVSLAAVVVWLLFVPHRERGARHMDTR
ncbi:MAG: ferrous iron transport protein B [Lachnospiraceae bacterium]|nr:ferrous iron transport protein B [Lachnospiraceae bacterium]